MVYKSARIISVGTFVPETVMGNKEFEQFLDTTDEWITTRTGIKERHIVPRDQQVFASELGTKAAQSALQRAGLSASDVDGIVCATFTPDSFFPSTAYRIQAALGCRNAFAFDMSAACAGFVYALNVANGMIVAGQARTILVIGAEVTSKTLDWSDRGTCILFGDGAGAVVLQESSSEKGGILSTFLGSDGSLGDILMLPAWGEKRFIQMNGNEVFKHGVRMMAEAALKVSEIAQCPIEKVDLLIPHQANIRILHAVADLLKFSHEKLVTNLAKYGNTSSASIPLALDEAWREGRIQEGTRVIFTALGGGVTVASALVQF